MPSIMMADPGGGRLGSDHHHMPLQHHMQQTHPVQTGHMDHESQLKLKKQQDLETLRNILTAWNANRLDLFELSMPNEVRKLLNDRVNKTIIEVDFKTKDSSVRY